LLRLRPSENNANFRTSISKTGICVTFSKLKVVVQFEI
jgi:hypothetical protein